MSKQSEYAIRKLGFPFMVPHADSEPRLVAWKSFLDLLEQIGVSRSDRLCTALILGVLCRWREYKVEENRAELNPWIFFAAKTQQDNQSDLDSELFSSFERKKILKGVQLLEGAGYVHKRRNPRHGYDKTWQYRLDMDVLKKDLEAPETALDRVEQRLGGQYLATVLSFWTLAAKYGLVIDEPVESLGDVTDCHGLSRTEAEVQNWTLDSPELDYRWSENGQAIPPVSTPVSTHFSNGAEKSANGDAGDKVTPASPSVYGLLRDKSLTAITAPSPLATTSTPPPATKSPKDVASENDAYNLRLAERYLKDNFTDIRDDILFMLRYFFKVYRQARNEVHPRLNYNHMARAILEISSYAGLYRREIVDRYFATPMDCDYRLCHFASDELLANRYYECQAERPYTDVNGERHCDYDMYLHYADLQAGR